MTEAESEALYADLIQTLTTRRDADTLQGRDDYLSPILAEIEAGKSVPIKLRVPGDREILDPVAGPRSSGASSAEFIQRQDFSGAEKLAILLRGLELAVVAPARMASELNDALKGLEAGEFDGVYQFGSDVHSSPTRIVTPSDLIDSSITASKLEGLIDEIRAELIMKSEVGA